MKTVTIPARTVRACSVRGCRRPHMAKGFCITHYMREYRAAVKERAAGGSTRQRLPKEENVDAPTLSNRRSG